MKKSKKTVQRATNSLDKVPKKAKRKPKSVQQQQWDTSIAPASAFEVGPDFAGALPAGPSRIPDFQKPQRGRRTLPNNVLLGFREDWVHFFEECWPEIGWHLLQIRKNGNGRVEDIQKIFEPIQDKDHCHHAKAFLRGSPQPVDAKTLRRNRVRYNKLSYLAQRMPSHCVDLKRSCTEAREALKQASDKERKVIQAEFVQRNFQLLECIEILAKMQSELRDLEDSLPGQEVFWYCSELLKFLRRKNAVEPFNLANAMAGLSEMGSRESHARCSDMPRCSPVRFPYRVFEVIERLWLHRPRDPHGSHTDFFRNQIPKLPKKDENIRDTLCRTWRDLQLAVQKCSTEHHSEEFMPYAITSAYIQNHGRDKTPAERILDERARLLRRKRR